MGTDLSQSNDFPNHGLLEDGTRHPETGLKPSWRGWIHTAAFPLAVILGIVLIVVADGAKAIAGSAVFFAASLLLFGTSAVYHRFQWGRRWEAVLRRLDHANIFLLIAGTYTPMSLLCLPRNEAVILLSIIWAGASLGIGFRIFWLDAPRWLYVLLYVLLGWGAILYIADFFRANWIAMILILIGGVFYTLGAVVYGTKRPDPLPRSFGFHEIFHAFTLLAFVCQWAGVFLVTINPPLT